ncbi:hypothetical protein HPB49_003107 [Dermacentor silvarum]|uniref:Uncharacterized protein n=1 Tax=Dermacentor silvarum TaxID=543639 RepID=A0ACB8DAE3_DERSI|nr:hypothetical protein HPB49_003107 [Dermacentor silvarum]
MAVVVRATVCMVGAAATIMALSVQSVYALWSLSADVVYVILFPQLVCLFYMQRITNTYGLISGVLVGVVTRALCGEPSMSVPVLVKLPLYDEQLEMQRFPHRTICMSLNLLTTVASSALWEKLFACGVMPKSLDCCRCFVPVDESLQQPGVALPDKKALDMKPETAKPPKAIEAVLADTCEDATSHETKVSPSFKCLFAGSVFIRK